jgi:methionyl-tRNA formyltransferase
MHATFKKWKLKNKYSPMKTPQNTTSDIKLFGDMSIAFFGSPQFAVHVLEGLKNEHIVPDLIITQPDKPAGRKLELTPPPAKIWAEEHSLSTYQPPTLKDPDVIGIINDEGPWDLFIVAAYGNIIPKEILDIPKYGTLNVHPSLLPKLRGASPIQSAILQEDTTGVSIMLMDEKMDHGPILMQEDTMSWKDWLEGPKLSSEGGPPKESELETITATQGARMLSEVIPKWIAGTLALEEQDHSKATFTRKVTKQDGEINLDDDPIANYRKIQAFDIWPRTYFFAKHGDKHIRVIITEATIENGKLVIKKVIPEGKKEMDYKTFVQS